MLLWAVGTFFAILPEVFLQRQLGQQERDLVGPAAFQIVKRVDTGFTDDGGSLGLGREVGRREREFRVFGERGGDLFAGEIVAVAEQTGKGDLAGDTAFKGTHACWQWAGLGFFR